MALAGLDIIGGGMQNNSIQSRRARLRPVHITVAIVASVMFASACGATGPSPTATPEVTPTPTPQLTLLEVVTLTKDFWEEGLDFQLKVIQRGGLDHVGWRQFGLCKSRYPGRAYSPYCGDFENFAETREDMEKRAKELAEKGTWLATWQPETQTWIVNAQRKSFFWDFRLLEETGDIEILPQS